MNRAPDTLTQRLENTFRRIERERMSGLPLLNPRLRIEAVDFRTHRDGWLGALITPWFINLIILTEDPALWNDLPSTSPIVEHFPRGECDFLVGYDASFGLYKSCALFSPALDVENQTTAREIAQAALTLLRMPADKAGVGQPSSLSRRAFLRGDIPSLRT